MSPPTNTQRQRRTEHRFYAEIVTDKPACFRDTISNKLKENFILRRNKPWIILHDAPLLPFFKTGDGVIPFLSVQMTGLTPSHVPSSGLSASVSAEDWFNPITRPKFRVIGPCQYR